MDIACIGPIRSHVIIIQFMFIITQLCNIDKKSALMNLPCYQTLVSGIKLAGYQLFYALWQNSGVCNAQLVHTGDEYALLVQ